MSKAEKFILENTNDGSIDITGWHKNGLPIYKPWLTPDQARKAVEIAREEMMAKAIDGVVTFDYYDSGDKTYGCVAHDSFCLENFGLKDMDKVKMILIKED